jgi:hypothetical protein
MWLWRGLAEPDPEAVPEAGRAWLAAQPPKGPCLSAWGYYARLDPQAKWIWTDSAAVPIVRRILEPVLPLYRLLTKVNVVLQIPGQLLGAHRDLVTGNVYDLESPYTWRLGSTPMRYEGTPWLSNVAPIHSASHRDDNAYLCLKIPISERADDAGNPFFDLGRRRLYYTSRNRFFFINEVEMLHGAEPATFFRGVVFVNGILNMDEIRRIPKRPIEVLRTGDAVETLVG